MTTPKKDTYTYEFIDFNNPDWQHHIGLANPDLLLLVQAAVPPSDIGATKVYYERFLYSSRNRMYDTFALIFAITPDGEDMDVERYYKLDRHGHWVEIGQIQYLFRHLLRVKD